MRLVARRSSEASHHHVINTAVTDERFVVSIRRAGLGDRLICLAAAWRYARRTGRTLVADWRFNKITPDPRINGFAHCFIPTPLLAGVPFVGGDEIAPENLPKPRYPAGWNRNAFLKQGRRSSVRRLFGPRIDLATETAEAVELIRAGTDISAPTVVFDRCVNDGLVSLKEARTFLSALTPAREIAGQVNQFRSLHFAGRKIIGLHVRHGNGGNIGTHAPYWSNAEDAIGRCVGAVRYLRQRLGPNTAIFLATDSADVRDALATRLSDVVTRAKRFRSSGEGELHLMDDAWAGRDDALVEMLLLGECDALIRYPPGSFFSFPAAARLAETNPALTTTYDLQRPFDSSDSLSPAIVVK